MVFTTLNLGIMFYAHGQLYYTCNTILFYLLILKFIYIYVHYYVFIYYYYNPALGALKISFY